MASETKYEWISALVDGQLAGQELQDARRKLAEDAEAQKLFEQLQSMRANLQSLPELKLGSGFTDRVMQRIGQTEVSRAILPSHVVRPKSTHWRMTIGVFSGVAALLLVGLVIFVNQHEKRPTVAVDDMNKKEAGSNANSYDDSVEQQKSGPQILAPEMADISDVDSVQNESSSGRRNAAVVSELTTRPEKDWERKRVADADADNLRGQDKIANRANGAQPSSGNAVNKPFSVSSESLSDADEPAEMIIAFARFKDGRSAKDVEQLLKSSQIEIAQTEIDKSAEKAASKQGGEFRRDTGFDETKSVDDAAKDRNSLDQVDVLVIEGSRETVNSVIDRFGQDGELQLAFNVSGIFNTEELASFAENGYFANLPDLQQGKALDSGLGGGADLAASADDQRQKKSGRLINKNENSEPIESEKLKLNEKANREGGKIFELKLGDSKQFLQNGKADLASAADGPEGELQLKGPTARYLKYGTPEFAEVRRELDAVLERAAVRKDGKESGKKAQPTNEIEKLPGKFRNQFAGDAKAQTNKLDQPLTEEQIGRKPQLVRLYILMNTRGAAPTAPAAALEEADGN